MVSALHGGPRRTLALILETYRLFVAISLPAQVRAEIERAQAELRNSLPRGCVRWTKPEQFHLTLKFLGNVKSQRVDELESRLRRACEGFSPLPLRAERIGFFPDRRYPRVIWAWVHDGQEVLRALQQAVETVARDFTTEKAEGKFTGHVTLGRCQGIRPPQAEMLSKLAIGMADRFFGAWTADTVELMRSELTPNGARHTMLAAIPLADHAASGKLPPT